MFNIVRAIKIIAIYYYNKKYAESELNILDNKIYMHILPCYLGPEQQRAKNFSQWSCVQKIFGRSLTKSGEMFEQILEGKPILLRYIRRSDELLQHLSRFLWILPFCKERQTSWCACNHLTIALNLWTYQFFRGGESLQERHKLLILKDKNFSKPKKKINSIKVKLKEKNHLVKTTKCSACGDRHLSSI